jgi:hypothetical protein
MKTLDLHGVKHCNVTNIVENFILTKNLPVEIITGNSFMMHKLVVEVLKKRGFSYRYKSDFNLGALIVTE